MRNKYLHAAFPLKHCGRSAPRPQEAATKGSTKIPSFNATSRAKRRQNSAVRSLHRLDETLGRDIRSSPSRRSESGCCQITPPQPHAQQDYIQIRAEVHNSALSKYSINNSVGKYAAKQTPGAASTSQAFSTTYADAQLKPVRLGLGTSLHAFCVP